LAFSAFDDGSVEPAREDLEGVLGRSLGRWDEILEGLEQRFSPVTRSWGFSGPKWGWNLRVRQGKRVIVYLTPQARQLVAGFALGERAVRHALAQGLADETARALEEAPRYAEGRGLRLIVRNRKQAAEVLKLAEAKMAR